MWKYSQSGQEFFVLQYCNHNTYIEVGSHLPEKWSNTFILETEHNYKGFGIEFDINLKAHWDVSISRKNKIYWNNALTFDYIAALKENNLDNHIGYLSCDIEPPENTFAALQKIIESGISFDCITFEHDRYASKTDFDTLSRKYLDEHGYKPIVENVYPCNSKKKIFETWFVNKTISGSLQSYDDWLKNLIL